MTTFEPHDVILGKYEVTKILGKGGMGRVLQARDRELDRLVAIKFLLPALRERPDAVSRFEREARTAARIQNEHVARVLSVEKVDGVPFLVMEYLDGCDLAAELHVRGPLPIAEAADLLLQPCEAVAEAHTLGIVHRDLKPGNLFLTKSSDGTPVLKVLDFGISKTAASEDVALTGGTAMLGSPVYMSPEQFESARSVDGRADIWSLGVVLYEMVTGALPFTGETAPNVWAAVLRGTYAKASSLRPSIPPALEELIATALAVDRNKRFLTVEAFAAKLAPFGTDAARASHGRIQRIAARADSPLGAVNEPDRSEWLVPTRDETRDGTKETASSLVQSQSIVQPPPRRWTRGSALGVAAAVALVGALGNALYRSAGPTPTSAAVSPLSGGTATPSTARSDAPCPDGATPSCEAACTAKEPGACHALARALQNGKGAAADPARAATLYQAECDSGGMAGCNMLGNLYDLGKGVPRDRDRALTLFQRACAGGLGSGCVNVGNAFAEGKVVVEDDAQAASFYQQGCDAGEPLGCVNLSVFHAEGRRGVPKDLRRAYTYAEKACAKGASLGCARVAKAKILGEGITKDTNGGLGQLDSMCTHGEVEGCKALAGVYEQGLGDVRAASLQAQEYRQKACELHDDVSCSIRKLEKTVNVTATMPGRINASLRDECNAGKMKSCELFGRDLIDGVGVPKDPVAGAEYLRKACSGGEASACGPGGR